MAPKNNAKAGKGKGKDATEDKGKGGKTAVKGAQSINVRHILVCSPSYASGLDLQSDLVAQPVQEKTDGLNLVRETR